MGPIELTAIIGLVWGPIIWWLVRSEQRRFEDALRSAVSPTDVVHVVAHARRRMAPRAAVLVAAIGPAVILLRGLDRIAAPGDQVGALALVLFGGVAAWPAGLVFARARYWVPGLVTASPAGGDSSPAGVWRGLVWLVGGVYAVLAGAVLTSAAAGLVPWTAVAIGGAISLSIVVVAVVRRRRSRG